MATEPDPRHALTRRALLALAAAGPAVALGGCFTSDWDSFGGRTFRLATGNPGGVFARYGDALATVLERRLDGLTTSVTLTDASIENLRAVADDEVDLGLSLGDAAADAARGSGSFADALDVVALTRTYDSFVHLVVRADSPVSTVADLRGRRVGLGTVGSGTRVVAERILQVSGLGRAELEVSDETLEADVVALREDRLDAFFFVSGLTNQAVLSLSSELPIRLVSLRETVSRLVAAFGPEYVDGPMPASAYGLADSVDSVSIKNYVVVSSRMPDDLAYAVTRVMFEAQADVERIATGIQQPSLSAAIFTSPLDLHAGAVRYFREQRL